MTGKITGKEVTVNSLSEARTTFLIMVFSNMKTGNRETHLGKLAKKKRMLQMVSCQGKDREGLGL